MIRGGEFGEYLADLAGDGCELDAPVPHHGRELGFARRDLAAEELADEYATDLPASPGPSGDSRAR